MSIALPTKNGTCHIVLYLLVYLYFSFYHFENRNIIFFLISESQCLTKCFSTEEVPPKYWVELLNAYYIIEIHMIYALSTFDLKGRKEGRKEGRKGGREARREEEKN